MQLQSRKAILVEMFRSRGFAAIGRNIVGQTLATQACGCLGVKTIKRCDQKEPEATEFRAVWVILGDAFARQLPALVGQNGAVG